METGVLGDSVEIAGPVGQIDRLTGDYLFCSFDLVGSTRFKNSAPGTWVKAIDDFYIIVQQKLRQACEAHLGSATNSNGPNDAKFVMMKLVGDEVVSYAPVMHASQILALVCSVEVALFEVYRHLRGDSVLGEAVLSHNLGVKAAVWFAEVRPPTDSPPPRNVSFVTAASTYDFVGIDMDCGFRVASHSYRGVVTLAPDLAWLVLRTQRGKARRFPHDDNDKEQAVTFLVDNGNIAHRLKLVDWVVLKGCWSERKAPVVWLGVMHDDWDLYDDWDPRIEKVRQQYRGQAPDGAADLYKQLKAFLDAHRRLGGPGGLREAHKRLSK